MSKFKLTLERDKDFFSGLLNAIPQVGTELENSVIGDDSPEAIAREIERQAQSQWPVKSSFDCVMRNTIFSIGQKTKGKRAIATIFSRATWEPAYRWVLAEI